MSQDQFPNNQTPKPENKEPSIFDRHQHKNPEIRRRQIRIMRVTGGVIGAMVILLALAWATPFGARVVVGILGDLAIPTPTPTFDVSLLDLASPTPPPTATILVGGDTFSQNLPTNTPTPTMTFTPRPTNTPTSTPTRVPRFDDDGNIIPEPTVQPGAIFSTAEPSVTPTLPPTPLPTREVVNFAEDQSELPTLEIELDPRCVDEPTRADYILCVVGFATQPIEP